jgi:hypothetical protein
MYSVSPRKCFGLVGNHNGISDPGPENAISEVDFQGHGMLRSCFWIDLDAQFILLRCVKFPRRTLQLLAQVVLMLVFALVLSNQTSLLTLTLLSSFSFKTSPYTHRGDSMDQHARNLDQSVRLRTTEGMCALYGMEFLSPL